jgi:hypothetical protein
MKQAEKYYNLVLQMYVILQIYEKGNEVQQTWFKMPNLARHWWLKPVILATQEAEIRKIVVRNQPGQIACEIVSQKNSSHTHKKVLMERLKVKALSSNPITPPQKKSPTWSISFPNLHEPSCPGTN